MKTLLSVILSALIAATTATANDSNALEGLDFNGPLPAIDESALEAKAHKDGLAGPSDIKKALDACLAEKKGPACVNEKLKAAGFKVPELPPGAKELDDCLSKADQSKPDEVKACFDKYAPRPGNVPLPDQMGSATATSTSTSTSTSTDTSTSATTRAYGSSAL